MKSYRITDDSVNLPLAGQVAVVTGASGQLGPIWCDELKAMGAEVYGMDLPDCDVSQKDQVTASAVRCCQEVGIPDILVLNAAIDNPPGSKASFFGNLEQILAVNLTGACNVVDAFLSAMVENGGGVIVGVTSIMGFIGADQRNYTEGFEKPVGYNLSKAGLAQFARSLTTQYGKDGIRACCIGFGPYDGGKLDKAFLEKFLQNVPLGRPVSETSVRAALRFAVTCPEFAGQTLMVEGGYLSL